jgi:hypothetical protein
MSQPYTQQEVKERAARILALPTGIRHGTVNEFHDMAAGESAYGIREEYYSGMPDQFFKDVLALCSKISEGGE